MSLTLKVTLLSDTTFGRGDGVAGLVDQEIEYAAKTGLPFIKGRTLKGLLVEECANLLFALENQNHPQKDKFQATAEWLFGSGGSTLREGAHLRVGQAELPEDFRMQVVASKYSPYQILEGLTTIRRQAAVDETTGVPTGETLRASRVLLRNLVFAANLDFDQEPQEMHLALLVACAACVRRVGSGRNRGRGRVTFSITDQENKWDFDTLLKEFGCLVKQESAS